MHELVSFAKSPYDMIAYDNRVRYDWPETHPQAAQEQVGGGEITNAGSQPGIRYIGCVRRTVHNTSHDYFSRLSICLSSYNNTNPFSKLL